MLETFLLVLLWWLLIFIVNYVRYELRLLPMHEWVHVLVHTKFGFLLINKETARVLKIV